MATLKKKKLHSEKEIEADVGSDCECVCVFRHVYCTVCLAAIPVGGRRPS